TGTIYQKTYPDGTCGPPSTQPVSYRRLSAPIDPSSFERVTLGHEGSARLVPMTVRPGDDAPVPMHVPWDTVLDNYCLLVQDGDRFRCDDGFIQQRFLDATCQSAVAAGFCGVAPKFAKDADGAVRRVGAQRSSTADTLYYRDTGPRSSEVCYP